MPITMPQRPPIPHFPFEALPRADTLASGVTERLEQLVNEGHFQPGDRLPSERELAEQFGVSRTVIREAVKALSALGIVEIKPGSGTLLRAPDRSSVVKSVAAFLQIGQPDLEYRKIHEVRRVLEVEIAGLAAQRRTENDLIALEASLEAMHRSKGDQPTFARTDLQFHVLLAKAVHNDLFVLLLDSVADILFQVRELGNVVPGAPEHALEYHQRILETVRAGREKAARKAMLEHLHDSEAIFNQAVDALRRSS